jgi:hypothetical protein
MIQPPLGWDRTEPPYAERRNAVNEIVRMAGCALRAFPPYANAVLNPKRPASYANIALYAKRLRS